jgi:hypothetical protein
VNRPKPPWAGGRLLKKVQQQPLPSGFDVDAIDFQPITLKRRAIFDDLMKETKMASPADDEQPRREKGPDLCSAPAASRTMRKSRNVRRAPAAAAVLVDSGVDDVRGYDKQLMTSTVIRR